MAFDYVQLQNAGHALADLALALSDGVQLGDDSDEAIGFLTAAFQCVDDFQDDGDAALFTVLGAAASRYAQLKRGDAGVPV